MPERSVACTNPNPGHHIDFPDVALAPNGDLVMVVRQCGPWAHQATFGFGRPLTFFETQADLLVLRSSDGGASFSPVTNLFRGLAYDPMVCGLPDGRLIAGAVVGEAGSRATRDRMHGVLHRHLPQLDTVITLHGMGLWFSEDSGATWQPGAATVSVPGWENAYNLRKVFPLADGVLIMPVTIGYPWRTRYVGLLRSWDMGETWGDPSYVAEDAAGRAHYAAGVGYWEPAMAIAPDGDMLCVCVEDDRSSAPALPNSPRSFEPADELPRLMAVHSVDSGFTWSVPADTGLRGDFPSMIALADGRLLLTWVQRRNEGARLIVTLSDDGGATWTEAHPLAQSPDETFYYPNSLALGDGRMVTSVMTGQPDLVRRVDIVHWTLADN
jgi:hypothetical protein